MSSAGGHLTRLIPVQLIDSCPAGPTPVLSNTVAVLHTGRRALSAGASALSGSLAASQLEKPCDFVYFVTSPAKLGVPVRDVHIEQAEIDPWNLIQRSNLITPYWRRKASGSPHRPPDNDHSVLT